MNKEAQRIAIAEACGYTDVAKRFIGDEMSIGMWEICSGVCGLGGRVVPDYVKSLDAMHEAEKVLTMEQAAKRLGTSVGRIKRLIEAGVLPATQVVPCAPWQILEDAIQSQTVVDAAKAMGGRRNAPLTRDLNTNQLMFSTS